jgi:hypothetical protein
MEESGKSSRGFPKPSNCQRNNRNLQTSSKGEVCLTSTAFNESQLTAPRFPTSQKKNRNRFVVRVNQFTTKFKSVFDSHYQMHIRLTHNRSRRFHISVETNLLLVHISVRTYILIYLYLIYAYRVRNNASFIIVNPITMDSIIFVGIDFRKLKKKW